MLQSQHIIPGVGVGGYDDCVDLNVVSEDHKHKGAYYVT